MSMLIAVILTAIITLAVGGIGLVIVKNRQKGSKTIAWDLIRPIISETITQSIQLMQAKTMGYQAIEDFAVQFVKEKVDTSTFLTKGEKIMISEDLIRKLIAPRLTELYKIK